MAPDSVSLLLLSSADAGKEQQESALSLKLSLEECYNPGKTTISYLPSTVDVEARSLDVTLPYPVSSADLDADLNNLAIPSRDIVMAFNIKDMELCDRLNRLAREHSKPFLLVDVGITNVITFWDLGDSITYQPINCGDLSDEDTEVYVGSISDAVGESGTFVTTTRPHGLQSEDTVQLGSVETTVISVISDLTISVHAQNFQQGCEVKLVRRQDWPAAHARLDVDGAHQVLSLNKSATKDTDCGLVKKTLLCAAGIVCQQLLFWATRRFYRLHNRFTSFNVGGPDLDSQSKSAEPSKKGKCVCVIGCQQLGFQVVGQLASSIQEKTLDVSSIILLPAFGEGSNSTDEVKSRGIVSENVRLKNSLSIHSLKSVLKEVYRGVSLELRVVANLNEVDFSNLDLVITTTGSYEERRSVDVLCVEHCVPNIIPAALGLRGHLETVVPKQTVSYSCLPDPTEREPPYCIIKSFPHLGEHAINWSVDKVERSFYGKPNQWAEILEEYGNKAQEMRRLLDSGDSVAGSRSLISVLTAMFEPETDQYRAPNWADCVRIARLKFEKYFNHKAHQLLTSLPPDTTTADGLSFWSWPKLKPKPVSFDSSNQLHLELIWRLACAYGSIFGVEDAKIKGECGPDTVVGFLSDVEVPKFVPKNKMIVTDERARKEDQAPTEEKIDIRGNKLFMSWLERVGGKQGATGDTDHRKAAGTIINHRTGMGCNLIRLFAYLRCDMYGIPHPKEEEIVGAFRGTVYCPSSTIWQMVGLTLGEVRNVLNGEEPSSWWVTPTEILRYSLPPPAVTQITSDIQTTIWDKWEVKGSSDWTLQGFLTAMQDKFNVEVTMVVQDTKMIYVPFMPGHKDRLPRQLLGLIKHQKGENFAILSLTATVDKVDEDITLPQVKYYF